MNFDVTEPYNTRNYCTDAEIEDVIPFSSFCPIELSLFPSYIVLKINWRYYVS